jgi:flagellar biosynthesis GTPase FlhF
MANQTEIYLNQCIKTFCNVHLNNKYYIKCIKLKRRLIKEKSITFIEKNIKIWAATIVYVVCCLNDMIPSPISSKLIHNFFGFSSVDVSNRAYSIMNKIYHKYEYWVNENNKKSSRSNSKKQKTNKQEGKQKTKQNKKEGEQDKQKTKQKNQDKQKSKQNKKEDKQESKKEDEQNKQDKQRTKQNKTEDEQNKQESKQNKQDKAQKENKNYPDEYYSYCKYLGLENNFTRDQLKNKYRGLMKIFHPDLYQNKSKKDTLLVENKSKEINIAYEYLNKYIS